MCQSIEILFSKFLDFSSFLSQFSKGYYDGLEYEKKNLGGAESWLKAGETIRVGRKNCRKVRILVAK